MRRKLVRTAKLATVAALGILAGCSSSSTSETQPSVEARKAPTLAVDDLTFKDLNKNGTLDPYEDWRLPVDERVADLISKMTVPEKAGLMVHASLRGFTGPGGAVLDAPATSPPGPAGAPASAAPSPSRMILEWHVRWILVRPAAGEEPEVTARFSNGVQEIAESSRLGIPATFSSDPRHSARPYGVTGEPAVPPISQWPEPIGFGAIGDPEVVREFGRIGAREYRALGLHVGLHPMADIATEPRWNRITGTFGEDAKLVADLTRAYVLGFQGEQLGPEGVLCVTKHWPGDGPVKDGLDPHNDYGRWQVYPGNQFDYHIIPFQAAFEAGTAGIMGAYAIPVGVDTVGMNFSKKVMTDLLRVKYGYDGYVVSDWNRNMPWGVEELSMKDRQRLMIEAGVDQLGGESDPVLIRELAEEGTISEARLNESARRILKPMFQMGLFEDPYVDPEQTKAIVASPEFVEAGAIAQRKSIVLLKNSENVLPISGTPRVYVENVNAEIAGRYGTVVDNPRDADVAIIKVNAPYAVHEGGGGFFAGAHEGTLAYAGAENAEELAVIRRVASSGTPTIVCMFMDRPAVLSEFIGEVDGVLAHFGVNDDALLDIVFGRHNPTGKLPFNLPRDMASVLKQLADVPHDLENPLFKYGFGLTYGAAASE